MPAALLAIPFAVIALLAALASPAAKPVDHAELGSLRLNQIQVIGTHNSYKAAIQPELLEIMLAHDEGSKSLDYAHKPIDEQLDLGLRNLELDVYHDPEGGHYRRPLGLLVLKGVGADPLPFNTNGVMDEPGFKVLHDCNFDYRSHEPSFIKTLKLLAEWSARHDDHLPVFITMNLKGGASPAPGGIDAIEWNAAAMRELDRVLLDTLGRDNLITPDDVRGEHSTLVDAIERDGWPTVDSVRGRFLFVVDHGGGIRDMYVGGVDSMAGRPMFTSGPEGAPYGVFHVINEPEQKAEAITRLVESGHIVRTRADAGTHEMRRGDRSRFEAAMRSGAQVITTDYPTPDTRHNAEYRV
ncbi:MAG: Ca2+-dependent phosphoinositide-specific phospholipase C, partial [Phycisphaerales bacterium JB064]